MAVRYLTKDLKLEIDEHSREIGNLKTQEAVQDLRIERNCKGVKRLSSAMDTVETALLKIEISNAQTNKIASWAIGIITTILVAVLIGLVTGQATLQFK